MLDIINHFFRMGISEEDYEKLKINLNSKNQKNLIFLSRILTILMVPGLIFVYVFYGGLKPRFWNYLSLFVFTFLSFLLAHRESKHTNLQIYIFISILSNQRPKYVSSYVNRDIAQETHRHFVQN